jgi:hypothetical protein
MGDWALRVLKDRDFRHYIENTPAACAKLKAAIQKFRPILPTPVVTPNSFVDTQDRKAAVVEQEANQGGLKDDSGDKQTCDSPWRLANREYMSTASPANP